jgi:ribosome-binding factor A
MTSRRMLRINDAIREELAELLRRDMRDPRLAALISVTEVDTAPDLGRAQVFVSVYGSDDETQEALRALRHAAGYLKGQLGDRLRLRRVPNLDFHLDPSLARGARVMQLLREIDQG